MKRKSKGKNGTAAGLTADALVANSYAVPRSAEERAAYGAELYQGNLRELNKVLAGCRGMYMVHLDSIGAMESVRKCRVSDAPKDGCFTIFLPNAGAMPKFGHMNMLSDQQADIARIMYQDATKMYGLQEQQRQAANARVLAKEAAETESTKVCSQNKKSLKSDAVKSEPTAKTEAVKPDLSTGLVGDDFFSDDEHEMPTFEDLLAQFKEEDAQRQKAAKNSKNSPRCQQSNVSDPRCACFACESGFEEKSNDLGLDPKVQSKSACDAPAAAKTSTELVTDESEPPAVKSKAPESEFGRCEFEDNVENQSVQRLTANTQNTWGETASLKLADYDAKQIAEHSEQNSQRPVASVGGRAVAGSVSEAPTMPIGKLNSAKAKVLSSAKVASMQALAVAAMAWFPTEPAEGELRAKRQETPTSCDKSTSSTGSECGSEFETVHQIILRQQGVLSGKAID